MTSITQRLKLEVSHALQCHPANVVCTRDLSLPQHCWCRFQCSSFTINGWWREACCLHLRYCPREVLVNSQKLGNYCEVGVIEFLRNDCWCKPSYTASATQQSLHFVFAVYRHRAAASECNNVWIFQAIFNHTPLLAHWSTKIKISVHAFLCCIIDKGWANPPFVCHFYCSCRVPDIITESRTSIHFKQGFLLHAYKASVMMTHVVTTQTTMSLNWRQHTNRIQEESIHKITAHHYGPSGHPILRDE